MTFSTLPRVIQGGMGVAVSDWRLANAVARAGQLGVVSGTLLDTVMVRRLLGVYLRRPTPPADSSREWPTTAGTEMTTRPPGGRR